MMSPSLSISLVLTSCLVLSGLSDPTDDLLRQEIAEAASDSRLLAEELADMLARLEVEETREQAVEAAVAGDDLKVESSLQDMLSKLEKLEQVAEEDSRSVELKGTLDEKLRNEEELRETLKTLETVAEEIKDVSSNNELNTIDEMTELLNSLNDKIEGKSGSGFKTSEELQSALHLNGIDEMLRSLEKVTGDLREMQDDLTDYFDDEETDTEEKIFATETEEEKIDIDVPNEEKNDNTAPKTVSEFIKSRNSTKSPEKPEEDDTNQRSREPKQLDDDAEYLDSEVEPEGEDCKDVEETNRVKICLPKFRSVEQEVNLYSAKVEEGRHCYDVTKTVCSQSSQIVSKEVCVYGYSQNIVVAHVQLAEINFERRIKKFSVSNCKPAIVKDGYKEKDIEACKEEYAEISYRLPSIVDNLDDFYELNLPEPELKCQLYKYEVPEVMCSEESRSQCSSTAHLQATTSSQYLDTVSPDYQGDCDSRTLSLTQKVVY